MFFRYNDVNPATTFSLKSKNPLLSLSFFRKRLSCLIDSLLSSYAQLFNLFPQHDLPPRASVQDKSTKLTRLCTAYRIQFSTEVRGGSNLNITNRILQLSDVTGIEPSPCPPSDQHCTTLLSGGLYILILI